MARRWTSAAAQTLANKYIKSDHSEAFAEIDAQWVDLCRRFPHSACAHLLLAATIERTPAANILSFVNVGMSARKTETAIKKHQDFSEVEVEEDSESEDDEVTQVKEKPAKTQHASKKREEMSQDKLDSLLEAELEI